MPSIVAAIVLDAQPGMRVLDMCAAPGSKTAAIADAMQDRGELIALDRSHDKVARIEKMVADMGLTCVRACRKDSTKLSKRTPVVRAWAAFACTLGLQRKSRGHGTCCMHIVFTICLVLVLMCVPSDSANISEKIKDAGVSRVDRVCAICKVAAAGRAACCRSAEARAPGAEGCRGQPDPVTGSSGR